jgi:hypothetical protein
VQPSPGVQVTGRSRRISRVAHQVRRPHHSRRNDVRIRSDRADRADADVDVDVDYGSHRVSRRVTLRDSDRYGYTKFALIRDRVSGRRLS